MPPSTAAPPTGYRKHLPNALTIARLALAAAFIAVLSVHRYPHANSWALWTGVVLFVVAAFTDALDGYLARRWNAVSVFGRVMDPFADKILVLGAFIAMAGPQFTQGEHGDQMTGVLPWMAVIILARELLVTSIRGVMEGMGVDFSASLSGKLKMVAQSVAVPLILVMLVLAVNGTVHEQRVVSINTLIAYAVTLATVLSAIPYVTRAMTALKGRAP